MNEQSLSLLFALGATLCFSSSSLVYEEFSKRVSVLWMNCFKATIAFLLLIPTVVVFTGFNPVTSASIAGFFTSGLIGLNIADLFLLSAFTQLGVARTLVLYGFQPLFVGIAAYFLFGQDLEPSRLLAVIFLIACLFTFSLERYRKEKTWEIKGLAFALIGVSLDTCGVLISRAAFSDSPLVTPIEGHFYRTFGALLGFMAMAKYYRPIALIQNFKIWSPKGKVMLILAAFGGTYMSLLLYLTAVRVGHLASISAIAITGPMFATTIECLLHRRWPSRYLLVAFAFFCTGFYILLRSN